MNEVTKLYENAKVEQKRMCEWACKDSEVCNTLCEHYESTQVFYPPFTAEKQISLMAFLINRKVELSFKAEQGEITVEAISRGLAGIVNRIWQDLTDTDKVQIKEILE